jgi:hypothetical protein
MELSTFHALHQTQIPGSTSNPVIFEDGKLIGRPYHLSSAIDAYSDINVGATADNPIVLFRRSVRIFLGRSRGDVGDASGTPVEQQRHAI